MRWLVPLLIALLVMASGCLSGGGEKVEAPKTLEIGSVFHEGDFIPKEYTCDGDDINPPIYVGEIPEGTKSLVVIVDDPDAPGGTFTHWIAWNIPPLGEIPQWIPKREKPMSPSTSFREGTTLDGSATMAHVPRRGRHTTTTSRFTFFF